MRLTFLKPITSCSLLMAGLISYLNPAQALTFDQQEINQSQFIAIARPYGNQQYDLLIIQQIPGQRNCWSENGSNPVTINPLLLNFDFTGSCERSTDSNGYSIRIDGQDLGLNYLLRIVERNNELFLVGTSRTNPNQPDVVVGRTYGIAPGLLKISLNPGWRFTKRAYQGKVLGHVYLTGDSKAMAPTNIINAAIPTPRSSSDNNPKPPKELTFTAEGSQPQLPGSIAQGTFTQPTSDSLPPPPVLGTPTTTNSQSPLPPPLPSVNSNSRKTLSDTLTNFSDAPNRPPTPQMASQKRYRVIAATNNATQQNQVRSLYPDAFPTSYKGRSVLQVGVFSSQDKAQQALQSLNDAAINGQIIPIP